MKTMWFIFKSLIVSFFVISIIITGSIIYYKTNIEQNLNETNLVANNNRIISDNTLANNEVAGDLKVELPGDLKVELPGDNVHIIQEEIDWRIILVNNDNPLPENFKIELANVGGAREFDARAASELINMIKAMKAEGASNIWIQSAYRTPEYQENLYNNKVQEFIVMGRTQTDAERLASKWVNKSETSEHNLGLAVDFNNVKIDFEKTKEFAWLVKNAEEYGFVLRYKKEKQAITKVNYDPWHWRYVGKEHAQKMNELDMCLEEYVEYLDKNT